MDLLIYFTAAALIISKFLDCFSTWLRIGGDYRNEQNRLTAWFMKKDINTTIWMVLLIAVVIICFSTWTLFRFYPQPHYRIAFIVVGMLITVVQLAVAHNNYYRRPNFITRIVQKLLTRIKL